MVGTPLAGASLIMGECQDDMMTSGIFIPRYLGRVQLMFVYLVLFMRHYTLKRTVVKAEDVEKTGVAGEPDQGNGEEHSEERTNEPSNDNGEDDDIKTVDVDEKRTLGGHDVDIKRLESHDV
jgi:hypothetical protein